MRKRIPAARSSNFSTARVLTGELKPTKEPQQVFTPKTAHRYANKLILRWLERTKREHREWKHFRKWEFRFLYGQMQNAQALAQAS